MKSGNSLNPTSMYRACVESLVFAAKREFHQPTFGINTMGPDRTIRILIYTYGVPPQPSQLQFRHVVWALSSWAERTAENIDNFRESEVKIFWYQKNIGHMSITKVAPRPNSKRRTARSQILTLPSNETTSEIMNTTVSPVTADELDFDFQYLELAPDLKGQDTFMTIIKAMAALAEYYAAERIPAFRFTLPLTWNCVVAFQSAGPDPTEHPLLEVGFTIEALRAITTYMVRRHRFHAVRGTISFNKEVVGNAVVQRAI